MKTTQAGCSTSTKGKAMWWFSNGYYARHRWLLGLVYTQESTTRKT